jgi:cyclopropane fatty-acyl-phospholipid synthase-like methyltransferase
LVSTRPQSPAAERNRGPLLQVLRGLMPDDAEVLEIGAGTGQHADYFTSCQPGWRWHPTTAPQEFETLAAGLTGIERPNLGRPEPLDVFAEWPDRRYDVVFSANTAHILEKAGVRALFRGAAAVLRDAGRFVLYGPFRRNGRHTADSNARFDQSLRGRDPKMGIRDLADIDSWAKEARLRRIAELAMPANNLTLIFEHESDRLES